MRACMFAIALLLLASCAASRSSQHTGSSGARDAGEIEDSGKRLAGDFTTNIVEDAYRAKPPAQAETVFSFDENGNFKRQEKSRVEEGGYVIGVNGELVIYIEKINGEQLPAARVERYLISDQSETDLALVTGSRKLALRKR